MPRSLEEILREAQGKTAAAEEETRAAAQTKRQSVIREIEEGASEHARLMSEDETATKRVKEIETEITADEEVLRAFPQRRTDVEANENLKQHPDLLAEALESLRHEEEGVRAALAEKIQRHTETETAAQNIRAQIKTVAEKAGQYLGTKEISPETLDAVWKYVGSERELEMDKKEYEDWAKLQAADIATMAATWTKGENMALEWDLDKGTYLHFLGKKIWSDSRIHNSFIDHIDAAIKKSIDNKAVESKFGADEGAPAFPLDDAAIEKIRNAAFKAKYRGKTITIWDGGKPILHEPEPTLPEVIALMTPNERQAVATAIQDRMQTKEALREALRLSEYSAETDEHFRSGAAEENAEYVRRKLAEKTPEADAILREIAGQEDAQQKEIDRLKALKASVAEYKKANDEPSWLRHKKETYDAIPQWETNLVAYEEEERNLPKTMFGYGRKPKDPERAKQLARRIAEYRQSIKDGKTEQTELEGRLKPLEAREEAARQAILALDSQAFDTQGILKLQEYEVGHEVSTTESKMEKIQGVKAKTEKAKELWEQGKFLDYSVREMQFIVSGKYERGEIDEMATSIAVQLENSFDQYRLWNRLPDTNWTVKNGELKQNGDEKYYFGYKVYGGDWDALAKLHSEKLSWLLAKKVASQLAKKFGDRVGKLKITVE